MRLLIQNSPKKEIIKSNKFVNSILRSDNGFAQGGYG